MNNPSAPRLCRDRALEIDALRGLAVLVWLLSNLALPKFHFLSTSAFGRVIRAQLSPSIWQGLTTYDLVLPGFLFAMGAAVVLSSARLTNESKKTHQPWARVCRRFVLLFTIGVFCEGGMFSHGFDIRWVGIFQRIAVCYVIATVLQRTSGWRIHAGLLVFLLLDYWAVLEFGPVPGDSEGPYTMDGSVATYFDQMLLPGRAYFGSWDPQGILTTIPALGVTIAGLIVGQILIDERIDSGRKPVWLIAVGVAALNLGYLWGHILPINPRLWTSSFVLVAIGWLCLILGALQILVTRRRILAVLHPIIAIGRNTLVVIAVGQIVAWSATVPRFLPTTVAAALQMPAKPTVALLQLVAIFGLAVWLDRRRTYVIA